MIAETNLQSILLTPGGGELKDGLDPGRFELMLAAGTDDSPVNEPEFWSMLNLQFAEITASQDVNLIENKDLLAAVESLEAQLAGADRIEIPAEWMQYLKSHFNESASRTQSVESAKTEDPIVIGALLAPHPVVGEEPIAPLPDGQPLPATRNIPAAPAAPLTQMFTNADSEGPLTRSVTASDT